MALDTKALCKIGQSMYAAGNVVNLWFYSSADAAATVEAAGYFNNARSKLKKGDMLLASMVQGGTIVSKVYHFATVPATGNITTAMGSVTAG